jgi:hypothetical protein
MRETGRYRRDGEPTNAGCDRCKAPIWKRISLCHTVSHGHEYWANSAKSNKPESVVVLQDNGIEVVCTKCFKELDNKSKETKT